MKRLIYIFAALLVIGISGCKEQKKPAPEVLSGVGEDSLEMADTTVYGVCGEGTAMHSWNSSPTTETRC